MNRRRGTHGNSRRTEQGEVRRGSARGPSSGAGAADTTPPTGDAVVIPMTGRTAERALFAAVAALLGAYLVTQLVRAAGSPAAFGMVELFNVDAEHSIPTWFSSMLLLLSAVAAGLIAAAPSERRRGDRRHWLLIAAVTLAISVDEVAAFHETLSARVQQVVDVGGLLYWAWVIPGAAVVVLLAVVEASFFRRLPSATRRRLVVAVAVFFAGALGMEMVGGWYYERAGERDLVYAVLVGVEEGLEMTGAVLFLGGLLRHLALRTREIRIPFTA